MPDYQWPDAEHRTLIGKRISRVDSPDKVSGRARYTYDVKRPEMLFGKMLRAPYAHCKVESVDVSVAEKIPGVKAIEIVQGPGSTIHGKCHTLGRLVIDAEPPEGASESQGPLSMDDIGDMLDNQVPENQMVSQLQQYGISFQPTEDDLKAAKEEEVPDAVIDAIRKAPVHPEAAKKSHSSYQKAATQTTGDVDKAFAEAHAISEGLYGAPVITHCCLESHGSTSEWTDQDHLLVHMSTQ